MNRLFVNPLAIPFALSIVVLTKIVLVMTDLESIYFLVGVSAPIAALFTYVINRAEDEVSYPDWIPPRH